MRPRWRQLELNDRSLRLHGNIGDYQQSKCHFTYAFSYLGSTLSFLSVILIQISVITACFFFVPIKHVNKSSNEERCEKGDGRTSGSDPREKLLARRLFLTFLFHILRPVKRLSRPPLPTLKNPLIGCGHRYCQWRQRSHTPNDCAKPNHTNLLLH